MVTYSRTMAWHRNIETFNVQRDYTMETLSMIISAAALEYLSIRMLVGSAP